MASCFTHLCTPFVMKHIRRWLQLRENGRLLRGTYKDHHHKRKQKQSRSYCLCLRYQVRMLHSRANSVFMCSTLAKEKLELVSCWWESREVTNPHTSSQCFRTAKTLVLLRTQVLSNVALIFSINSANLNYIFASRHRRNQQFLKDQLTTTVLRKWFQLVKLFQGIIFS